MRSNECTNRTAAPIGTAGVAATGTATADPAVGAAASAVPAAGSRPTCPPADDAAAWFTGPAARRLVRRRADGHRRPRGDHRDRRAAAGSPESRERRSARESAARAEGRIQRFREDTREARMQIADEAEARYGRKVAWGASIGDTRGCSPTWRSR